MHELIASEVALVGGGMRPNEFVDVRVLGVMAAFEVGYIVGTYIDQRWIAPLWR